MLSGPTSSVLFEAIPSHRSARVQPPSAKRRNHSPYRSSLRTIWWPKYSTGGGRRGVNSPTTLMEKDMHLRVHILPALGELSLAEDLE